MGPCSLELVEIIGHLPYASNTTVLAADADGGFWVYKPMAGEQPLWDFPWKTLAAREVATFEVSEALGIDSVPETFMADGPFGPGSAQRFLDEDEGFDPRPLFNPRIDPVLWPVALLDVVTNNADRKIGHILRERGTGKLWAIDNGLTFHPMDKLRTVMWGFAGQTVPADLVAALRRLDAALATGLWDRLAELLSPSEADVLGRRVEIMLEHPIHPEPPDDRPAVPWPVW